jgi:lipid-A-disaccharide synthase
MPNQNTESTASLLNASKSLSEPLTITCADHSAKSSTQKLDILLIAGEPSGDMHAAKLVRELQSARPGLTISAMGGEELAATGTQIIVDNKELAVVGFIEVIKVWSKIRHAFKILKKTIREQRPKIVILVDYPGFNLRMAQFAKQQGCQVVYYIGPQVWAWHQSRVHKIKRCVDLMAVIFPFEVDFFQQFNIPTHFVGHPLATEPLCPFTPEQAKKRLNLQTQHPVIGLLPGSRNSEVRVILPALLAAATLLYRQNPELQFILPKASNIDAQWLKEQLALYPIPIKVTTGQRYTTMQACDIAVAASGTVTLELALLEKPMIITYKSNPITFWLGKKLVKLKSLGLPNIIAANNIVPELLQSELTAENITHHVNNLLANPSQYATQKNNLAKIHNLLRSDATKVSLSKLLLENL